MNPYPEIVDKKSTNWEFSKLHFRTKNPHHISGVMCLDVFFFLFIFVETLIVIDLSKECNQEQIVGGRIGVPGTSAQGFADTGSKRDSDVVSVVFPVKPAIVLVTIVTTNHVAIPLGTPGVPGHLCLLVWME